MLIPQDRHLWTFKNRYPQQTAVVIASGPTKINYAEKLPRLPHPIFFVNDAVRFEEYAITPAFFFSQHCEKFCRLVKKSIFANIIAHRRPTETYIENDIHKHIKSPYFDYTMTMARKKPLNAKNITVQEEDFPDWAFDRNEIIKRQSLLGHTGSITTLIHFLWFAGFSKAIMIGCNPIFQSTKHTHDSRISALNGRTGSASDLKAILVNQVSFLRHFNITPTYWN